MCTSQEGPCVILQEKKKLFCHMHGIDLSRKMFIRGSYDQWYNLSQSPSTTLTGLIPSWRYQAMAHKSGTHDIVLANPRRNISLLYMETRPGHPRKDFHYGSTETRRQTLRPDTSGLPPRWRLPLEEALPHPEQLIRQSEVLISHGKTNASPTILQPLWEKKQECFCE